MLRLIYSFVLTLATPLILIRLYLRSLKVAAYRTRIGERFGYFDPPQSLNSKQAVIWIHAVSVGETVATAPLVKAMQERYPERQFVITTMTPTGSERVRELFGDRVFHVYCPYDLPFAVSRFLRAVRPGLLILMETELWPNIIHYCSRRDVKIILANARLSARSARGYSRLGDLAREMLANIDAVAAQSSADGERLIELGAAREKLTVTGSLKFNVEMNASVREPDLVFDSISTSSRKVVVAASTRAGEERKVLSAFSLILKQNPETLFLLIPRHPERFDEVAELGAKLGFKLQRRSAGEKVAADTQLLLGDSMGEMHRYYRLADIAFVGGSLVDTGCQNVLEPAALALPVITGPSQFNFAHICGQLEQAGALITVDNESQLASCCSELLKDEERRQQMGAAGKTLVEANQQALPNLLKVVEELLDSRSMVNRERAS